MEFQNKPVSKDISAVDVFLENRKSRTYVGRLKAEMSLGANLQNQYEFVFEYDKKYLYSKNALSLGPDLPLTKRIHKSSYLFKTLNDRIPSSKNPAYKDYCDAMGISTKEKNPIILLGTIGRRGPSSFIFEPVYVENYSGDDLKKFRDNLGLTIREFASVFDFDTKTIHSVERNKSTGRDALKRIMIYDQFPEVAIYEVEKNGSALNDMKRAKALEYLRKNLKKLTQKI